MKNTNVKTKTSISEKLSKLDIPQEEKEIIVENGLRYRILESEMELKKITFEILKLEKDFGMPFEELKEVGLPNDADYKTHEDFMDLEALIYDRLELQKRIGTLKKLYNFE